MFTVNKENCTACGMCAKICPVNRIVMDRSAEKPVPSVAANMEKTCFACGHCEAGCPHGAIELVIDLPGEKTSLLSELSISPAQIGQHLRGRRSIRHFKEEPVDMTVMKELMDIVRFAPSATNLQPLHWLMIYDRDQVHSLAALHIEWIKQLLELQGNTLSSFYYKFYKRCVEAWSKGEDLVCRGAPHLALVHAHKDYRFAPVDAVIALTYLEVAAPVYGVGACWAGGLYLAAVQSEALQNSLALPAEHVLLGAMMLGYPRYEYNHIPRRKHASIEWR